MAAATPRTLVLLLALWLLASPGSAIRLPGFQRDCSNKAHKARAGSVVLGDSGFAFSAAAEGARSEAAAAATCLQPPLPLRQQSVAGQGVWPRLWLWQRKRPPCTALLLHRRCVLPLPPAPPPAACPSSHPTPLRAAPPPSPRSDPSPAGGVAWGSFLDGAHTRSNFGQLRVATSGAYADADQLFAAGFLEGFLTAERVYDNFVNMRDYFTGAAGMGAEIQTPMKWWASARWAAAAAAALDVQALHCLPVPCVRHLAAGGRAAMCACRQSRMTLRHHLATPVYLLACSKITTLSTLLPHLCTSPPAAGLRSSTAGCVGSAALRQCSRARMRASGRWVKSICCSATPYCLHCPGPCCARRAAGWRSSWEEEDST